MDKTSYEIMLKDYKEAIEILANKIFAGVFGQILASEQQRTIVKVERADEYYFYGKRIRLITGEYKQIIYDIDTSLFRLEDLIEYKLIHETDMEKLLCNHFGLESTTFEFFK